MSQNNSNIKDKNIERVINNNNEGKKYLYKNMKIKIENQRIKNNNKNLFLNNQNNENIITIKLNDFGKNKNLELYEKKHLSLTHISYHRSSLKNIYRYLIMNMNLKLIVMKKTIFFI